MPRRRAARRTALLRGAVLEGIEVLRRGLLVALRIGAVDEAVAVVVDAVVAELADLTAQLVIIRVVVRRGAIRAVRYVRVVLVIRVSVHDVGMSKTNRREGYRSSPEKTYLVISTGRRCQAPGMEKSSRVPSATAHIFRFCLPHEDPSTASLRMSALRSG